MQNPVLRWGSPTPLSPAANRPPPTFLVGDTFDTPEVSLPKNKVKREWFQQNRLFVKWNSRFKLFVWSCNCTLVALQHWHYSCLVSWSGSCAYSIVVMHIQSHTSCHCWPHPLGETLKLSHFTSWSIYIFRLLSSSCVALLFITLGKESAGNI